MNIESEHGSSMIIPREGDVVRFYTQLLDADVVCPLTKRVDKNRVTPQKLVSVRIFKEVMIFPVRSMSVGRR